jgi:uncharacterized protein (DUF169 family)
MSLTAKDFFVLDQFKLERKPVGVKFMASRPTNVIHLEKTLNFCEMLKEAQTSEPFYVSQDDFVCVEKMLLGFEDPEPILVSGMFGGREKLFQEERACREMYNYLPYMKKGSVHSVAFAAVDKLPFDPDVLVMVCDIAQGQTLLRSLNYSSGEPITAKFTPVCMCAWMYNYPVVSGNTNFFVTGLGLGMQALNIFPAGLIVMSVPWTKIPTMLNNLKEMDVARRLKSTQTPGVGGDVHRQRVATLMTNLRKELTR